MRSTLRSLKMIFDDEVSMVSSLNLAYMHLRLGRTVWWTRLEGMSCLLGTCFSCSGQWQSRVWEDMQCHKLGCATSVNIWTDSVVYDELTINERQKKDEEFSKMLDWWSQTTTFVSNYYKCNFWLQERQRFLSSYFHYKNSNSKVIIIY